MGVGVSCVISISAFWWSLAPRYSFLLLPFKLFGLLFPPETLQKCAAVNTHTRCPSCKLFISFVAGSCPHNSEMYIIWSLAWALTFSFFGRARAEIHPPLITNVIVQASPYRWKGRRLSRWNSAARNECHVGRDCTRPQQRIWGGALTPGARRCAPRLPERPRFKC